jgi:hypothetical protein
VALAVLGSLTCDGCLLGSGSLSRSDVSGRRHAAHNGCLVRSGSLADTEALLGARHRSGGDPLGALQDRLAFLLRMSNVGRLALTARVSFKARHAASCGRRPARLAGGPLEADKGALHNSGCLCGNGSLADVGCLMECGALNRSGGGPTARLGGVGAGPTTARFKGATFTMMATAEIGAG